MTNEELLELIKTKKVDMFWDIFESDNYDEYCGFFDQQYNTDRDFHKYKVRLTREEFDALYDYMYDV